MKKIFFMYYIGQFKLGRKFIGGKWYYNRYIFDLGRSLICVWEKEKREGRKVIKTETY